MAPAGIPGGGYLFPMNLNEVIQRIPTVIRGRFAGNANAAWIMWAGDTISRINGKCPGLGRVRTAPLRLMKSGFIRNPSYLTQIGNVYVDGQEVAFSQQNGGLWLDGDDLTEKGLTVSCSEYPATAENVFNPGESGDLALDVSLDAASADFPTTITGSFNYALVNGTDDQWVINNIAGMAGTDAEIATDLVGRAWVSGDYLYRIVTASVMSPGLWLVTFDSQPPQASPPSDQPITGLADDAFAGWSFSADADFFDVAASTWKRPANGDSFTTDLRCSVDFKEPTRPFTTASGVMFKSNVTAKGYEVIKRPISMTEQLDLTDEYADLLALGMRMKAELDMAPASADAGAATALFEQALRRYAVDHQNADGNSVKRAFNSSPRLGRYSR